ncbi:glycine, alanine and asparagine-rich protein-like [Gossypium australe]|uniref:Glycine, alanine and asparagine-rich protein-like n=1 Tax=Gossypium australe TaxID=47621 RepID=A0A5B6WJ04_9ROSI|nr:glycine, alanine and asparagine-rich protein-like [Gossypium australe]
MSCFLLSKSLCTEMENIMGKFWWQVNEDGNGGLSFCCLSKFNLALLPKQGWHLILIRFHSEAVGCIVAMKLCLDLGLRRLEVEGDSLTMIKKAKSNEDDRSEISAYIEDMKKMTKDFKVYNGVAHQSVSEGLKLKLTFFESNDVLDFVEELVEQDRCWSAAPD